MEADHIKMAMILLLVTFHLLGFFISSSQAYTFYVGGQDGWVLKPKEDYNHWASRNRFQINDALIFKYKQGHDTVLEVGKDDYFACNKEKPLQALKDGVSEFKFNRSGPFFFISGHADSCAKGQRIIIVVLHPRIPPPPAAAANSPSPAPAVSNSPSLPPAPAPAVPVVSPPPVPTPPPHTLDDHFAPAPAPSCGTTFDGPVLGFSVFAAMVTLGLHALSL